MPELKSQEARSESEQSSYVAGRKARAAKRPRDDVPADVAREYWQLGWDQENSRRP